MLSILFILCIDLILSMRIIQSIAGNELCCRPLGLGFKVIASDNDETIYLRNVLGSYLIATH